MYDSSIGLVKELPRSAGHVGESRVRLSRDRVLSAAVRVADESGIETLTMRRLAEDLGSEAMSLYYHVSNKEDVLDGIAEVVAAEINDVVDRLEAPAEPWQWKSATRRRILAARKVVLRHPWVPEVLETRTTTGPAVLHYHDRLVGLLRAGGFSYDLVHRALHALGSRSLGFTQELFDPGAGARETPSAEALSGMAVQLPNLVGLMSQIVHDQPDTTLGWCDAQAEFEFGLDLILDGLDRLRPLSQEPRAQ
ncbi:TetR/AcrR family transcriptional regulator C-terminal domain-containing protein [Micromonospora sp. DT81.3]|uniref:TetR/AcrR family transcriptional regulator C-terminal domain-containing protein n=1 Tax=Micromonospora sp. DT81.3 TaxID=3416523 RepID=UPI003CE9A70C